MPSQPSDPPVPNVNFEDIVAQLAPGGSEWLMVDVGGMAVSNSTGDVLTTSAPVGSTVAVCLPARHR